MLNKRLTVAIDLIFFLLAVILAICKNWSGFMFLWTGSILTAIYGVLTNNKPT